jgi:large conductance mechanosensitive channel
MKMSLAITPTDQHQQQQRSRSSSAVQIPILKAITAWQQFKQFVIQTRVLETGVGVVIGKAFREVVKSFVNDVLVPPITYLFLSNDIRDLFILLKQGKTAGLRYRTLPEALRDGAITLNTGRFLRQGVNFFVVGLSVCYLLKGMPTLHAIHSLLSLTNRHKTQVLKAFFSWSIKTPFDQEQRHCPFCFSCIPMKATRCSFCTSILHSSVNGSPSSPSPSLPPSDTSLLTNSEKDAVMEGMQIGSLLST